MNVFLKANQYEAGLSVVMHIYRLRHEFYYPTSEIFSILTTMTHLADKIKDGLALEMIEKCRSDFSNAYCGDFEQLIAMYYYHKGAFKKAYTHQKQASKYYEEYNPVMVLESEAMTALFVKKAVEAAKQQSTATQ